ncbi:hypothetical protein [Cytobacillus purgationiresistens]|uniref:Uncharacterized protein n=1 Tax=Cytobacillus purgationiresistens TaxID=863449 RepID=A0ABU0AMG3_9BACI|nr:hypothetical protein [Cytobacillus purgationiresistens]MDQ0271987.1 hypothetical protein [Cytobacillus purgationiresistens]
MYQEHHHILSIIDFNNTQYHSTFVKITGYDAVLGNEFEGEVKFVSGMPFGDLIHPQRSFLSSECRQFVRTMLVNKYNEGAFS